MKSPFPPFPLSALSILALFLFAAPCALAEEQRVDVVRNGVQTTLVLPQYTSQGIPYASLADVARQIGGSVEVQDARAVLGLEGKSVSAGLEDDKIQVGSEVLGLQHPVRGYNGDALIAIADLVPVLRASFGFGTPDNPPTTSALSLESVEPVLESVEAPPSEEAMAESDSLESIDLGQEIPLESVTPAETVARPLSEPTFGASDRFLLAIDPGHGGDDTGVVGSGGLVEKDLCLAVAESVRRVLKEQYGISTISTREQDESQSMKLRRQAMSAEKPDLVLSIHGGSNPSPSARGPMLFAHVPPQTLSVDAKPGLAAARSLATALEDNSEFGAPIVHEMPLLLMRDLDCPGVLVELGNLKNPDDEAQLASPSHQAQLASALAAGISQLLERSRVAEASR